MSAADSPQYTDPSSYSNLAECYSSNIDLSLNVDFDTKTLSGTSVLTVHSRVDGLTAVHVDTRDLAIASVAVVADDGETPVEFNLTESSEALGQKLEITLKDAVAKDDTVRVAITYTTSPDASAIQWLAPEQTADKTHPYLFTQCQAIHARSLLPCQDSPSSKVTYTATISVPEALVARMSAILNDDSPSDAAEGRKTYAFTQAVPIPSYLFALVVGNLDRREIGPRSDVWSEPSVVEAAAYEFGEAEEFIATGESILGPYVWTRYDVLCLPPSFPYGGMENPSLTFVTPTLLAGDRSLADVVAHEIAHSWMGNLVTNRFWCDFWLNEGHTVYIERMILRKMSGEPARQLSAHIGWKALERSVDGYGADHAYTALIPNLDGGVDPDDAFSSVPYEKGFNLLYHLEGLLGGPDVFCAYLKAYVEKFAYKSITTADWKGFLYTHFADKTDVLDSVDWDTWFNGVGLPPKPEFDTSLVEVVNALSDKWVASGAATDGEFSEGDIAEFNSSQVVMFLENVIAAAGDGFDTAVVAKMNEVYNFEASKNSEIRFRWSRLVIKLKCADFFPGVLEFATSQGRMKFVRPLYKELFECGSETGRELAVDTFVANESNYHPICAKMVRRDLQLDAAE